MLRRPPRSTRTDTLFPYTTLFRSGGGRMHARDLLGDAPVLVVNIDNLWIDGPTDAIRELAAGWDDARTDALLLLVPRSEEPTSELQSLMRISYAVFCLKKKILDRLDYTSR